MLRLVSWRSQKKDLWVAGVQNDRIQFFSESGWIKRSSRHPREITPLQFLCDHQSHCYIAMWLKYDPKTSAKYVQKGVYGTLVHGPKVGCLIETEKTMVQVGTFSPTIGNFLSQLATSHPRSHHDLTKWSHRGAGQDLHIFRGAPGHKTWGQKISMGGDWYEKVMKKVMFMFKVKCEFRHVISIIWFVWCMEVFFQ